jgi:gliding motility-associated-like protein
MKKAVLLLLLTTLSCYGQFQVDTGLSEEELIRDILVNSSCAETSNYTSYTGTDFGVNGIGYFNSNGARFQYREGIILSTGNAADAVGPNNQIYTTGDTDWPGDNDLRTATGTGNLFNASYIQFDFVPSTNSISFNFLFASEEYSDNFQCTFSDVFAFILTDANGISSNLAVIPGTDSPVSATTIRPGVEDACEPANEDFFGGLNGENSGISFFGQTKSLVAFSEVNPGENYTIKLVIADNLDADLDSAVFLEAGSFSIDVSLGENRTVANGKPLCIGEELILDATSQGAQSYVWYRDGTQLTAFDDIPVITVNDDGFYEVEVVFSAVCISNGAIEIEYIEPPLIAEQPLDINACDLDGNDIEPFDFTANRNRILGNQNDRIYKVYFFETQEDAENLENNITRTSPYFGTEETKTIFARISSGESCYEITSFEIFLRKLEFVSPLAEEYPLCLDEDNNPLTPLPLLDTGLATSDYNFQWYKDVVREENRIPNATANNYSPATPGTYFVVLENLQFGCEFTIFTKVVPVSPPTLFEIVPLNDLFSGNNSIAIEVEGGNEYLFAVDDSDFTTNSRFDNLEAGEHIAYVTDTRNCTVLSQPFLVVDYPKFFTPNGDGTNDTWKIIGLSEIENAQIYIYDRFGKLHFQFNDEDGWNGNSNGKLLPSSDYWFKISYTMNGEQKEFKNHFSLKR